MQLIDSHCHLNLNEFNGDVDNVVERALLAGVKKMVVVGTDLNDSLTALELAHKYDSIFAAVGIHPHNTQSATESDYKRLQAMAGDRKIAAYGEIGLDFYRNHSPKPLQKREFARQINLAASLKLPVIIHDREAHQEVYDIIVAEEGYRNGGVIHCFSADITWARRFVELGFVISIPGTVTFPRSQMQKEVAEQLSLDDILIETDAPFLTPVPFRGKRNEPAYVEYVAREIAGLRNLEPDEVALATSRNCERVFNLDG